MPQPQELFNTQVRQEMQPLEPTSTSQAFKDKLGVGGSDSNSDGSTIAAPSCTHHTVVVALDLRGCADFLIITHSIGAAKAGVAQLATPAAVLAVGLQVLWQQKARRPGAM